MAAPAAVPVLTAPAIATVELVKQPPMQRLRSRVPAPIRFSLAVGLSLSVPYAAHILLQDWSDGELAKVSRTIHDWPEIAILVGWKLSELTLCWAMNLDGLECASLGLLTRAPSVYLLTTFYDIRSQIAAADALVDIVSIALPVHLLRTSPTRSDKMPLAPPTEPVADKTIRALVCTNASLVYMLTIYVALKTYLPDLFVLYFTGIPTIEPALDVSSTHHEILVLGVLCGLAAQRFVFAPFATPSDSGAMATTLTTITSTKLTATITPNTQQSAAAAAMKTGLSRRIQAAVKRAAVLVVMTGGETYLEGVMTIQGVDAWGAWVYAATWVGAAAVTGLAMCFVGNE